MLDDSVRARENQKPFLCEKEGRDSAVRRPMVYYIDSKVYA